MSGIQHTRALKTSNPNKFNQCTKRDHAVNIMKKICSSGPAHSLGGLSIPPMCWYPPTRAWKLDRNHLYTYILMYPWHVARHVQPTLRKMLRNSCCDCFPGNVSMKADCTTTVGTFVPFPKYGGQLFAMHPQKSGYVSFDNFKKRWTFLNGSMERGTVLMWNMVWQFFLENKDTWEGILGW